MRDLMKFDILLPFETRLIETSKSKEEIINIFLKEIDQTWYVDLNKQYRGKINDDKIHLWNNFWFHMNQQHYFIEFIELNNEVTVKMFSRNKLLWVILYICFMTIGIIGMIIELISFDLRGVFFLLLWVLFIFIILCFIPRYIINEDIKYFTKLME